GADTLLSSTASGAIALGGAVTGNGFDLTVNTAGLTTFGGAINGVDALNTDAVGSTLVNNTVNAVSVTLADSASLNAAITTLAGQTYAALNLGGDSILNSTLGGAINLGGAVTGNGFDLTVNTAGQTIFG